MSAEIIDLPRPDDDVVVCVSGLPLVDIDPAVVARRLNDKPWSDRAFFFNSIYCESVDRQGEMLDHIENAGDQQLFIEWATLAMHERIGQTLDIWGEDKPAEDVAALLFALSLNPHHRGAARVYFRDRARPHPSQQFNEIAAGFGGLKVFYNLSQLVRPGLSQVWRQGVPDNHGVLFMAAKE